MSALLADEKVVDKSTRRRDQESVSVEFWENQKYRPFKGWVPISFSNLLGTVTLDFQAIIANATSPKVGWEWSDEPWKTDADSKMFGETDDEGWSYESSFEQLVLNTSERTLKADKPNGNSYRRRRWLRSRHCISNEALEVEQSRRDMIKRTCATLRGISTFHYKALENLQDFNFKWLEAVDNVLAAADFIILNVMTSLHNILDKLKAFNAFLKEIAAAESVYASKLRDVSLKWGSHVITTHSSGLRPRFSLSPARTFIDELKDAMRSSGNATDSVEIVSNDPGFFKIVSSTNRSLANQKSKFAEILSDMLPKDVIELMSQVEEVLEECNVDGKRLRSALILQLQECKETKTEATEKFHLSIKKNTRNKSALIDSLNHWSLCAEADTSTICNPDYIDCNFPSTSDDCWLWTVSFCKQLLRTNSKLLQYFAEAKMLLKKVQNMALIAGNFFRSTIKMLVHEHFKSYQESLDMLEALGIENEKLRRLDGVSVSNVELVQEGDTEHSTPSLERESINGALKREGIEFTPQFRLLSNNSSILLPFVPVLSHIARSSVLKLCWSHNRREYGDEEDVLNTKMMWFNALCILTFDHWLHVTLIADSDPDANLQSKIMKLDTFEVDVSFPLLRAIGKPISTTTDHLKNIFEVRFDHSVRWHNLKLKPSSGVLQSLLAATDSCDGMKEWLDSIASCRF